MCGSRSARRRASFRTKPRRTGLRVALANDRDAPGLSRGEERVRVNLVGPAEEMPLGVVVGRAVDGWAVGRGVGRLAALGALEVRETLLGRRPFCVSLAHGRMVRRA